jgi:serine/threonine-protein kinase RsbW
MCKTEMTVAIDSRLEDVARVGALVRVFCEGVGLSHAESADIELCIVEAANNSIVHGYSRAAGQRVEVFAHHEGDLLWFEVRDHGKPMDPRQIERTHLERPDLKERDLDSIPERGRGLAIIKAVMNQVQYHSNADVNRLIMTKRMQGAPKALQQK